MGADASAEEGRRLMRIFLIGLRRSGTTAFFDLFRQDARLTCFDEPFNPMIRDIPARDEWGTKAEYIRVYDDAPDRFWHKYAYIDGLDEIREGLSPHQADWLRHLFESAPATFMDFTRLHFKLDALHRLAPDAVLVHLHRTPAAFATSHILPSPLKFGRRLKYLRRKQRFWKTRKKYNTWGMETIIGRSAQSACAQKFAEAGLDPAAIYGANAATRLVAFWRLAFDIARADGARLFGGNYVQVPFERFTRNPAGYMDAIYERTGETPPAFDYGRLRPAKAVAFAGHPGWHEAGAIAGLDPEREDHEGDLIL
jgi:hypothetical protein